jgi:hypothetical protein
MLFLISLHFMNRKVGDSYVLADLGGGTADLVVHKYGKSSKDGSGQGMMSELAPGSGGICGGIHVDDLFLEFMRRKIQGFDQFEAEHPKEYYKLVGSWDAVKRSFTGKETVPIQLSLPTKLISLWRRQRSDDDDDDDDDESMELSVEVLKSFFDPVVDGIISLIRDQHRKAVECGKADVQREIDNSVANGQKALLMEKRDTFRVPTLVLVGGLATSKYVQERIKSVFKIGGSADPKSIRSDIAPTDKFTDVIIPLEPGAAVMKGAVFAGLMPNALFERKARFTYAIEATRDSEPGDPPEMIHGRFTDFLKPLVTAGETIPVNFHREEYFVPASNADADFRVRIFRSPNADVKYRGKGVEPVFKAQGICTAILPFSL